MPLSLETALGPAASTDELIEMVGSRATCKNRFAEVDGSIATSKNSCNIVKFIIFLSWMTTNVISGRDLQLCSCQHFYLKSIGSIEFYLFSHFEVHFFWIFETMDKWPKSMISKRYKTLWLITFFILNNSIVQKFSLKCSHIEI